MAYRVAVASSDGKVVNQHFGRSRQFLIFEITDSGEWSLVEHRENVPPCGFGDHHEDGMKRSVELLSDCSKVLVSQIGPGAEQALKLKGITAYAITDFIENAFQKLIEYDKKTFRLGV
ncbi:MAG: dinitrogenase iron-molybdenum cofactor biosynthesis protein [Clostridia bacterium]|nr:dinitrogenase iron-molybdenum cofactor biosynthesis protein [Clostridia bacterium]